METQPYTEVLVERLATLDHEIDKLTARAGSLRRHDAHASLETLEQTISVLSGTRSVYRDYLALLEARRRHGWPWS